MSARDHERSESAEESTAQSDPVTVAVIGAGDDPEDTGPDGFAMGYRHARGYEDVENCRLAAVADIEPENASGFADAFGLSAERAYTDTERMLAEVDPDVVSVTTPPHVHADLVQTCARGGVDAVHCEKPMAATWGDARLLLQEARRHDLQLTFNHQRRFKPSWERAAELLDDGAIGQVERVETTAPNLYDWGTHCFDALGFFTGDTPAEWVLSGLDYSEENVYFGVHNENQAVTHWQYESGIQGVAFMGVSGEQFGWRHRIVGSEGDLRVDVEDGPAVDVRRFDGDGETNEVDEELGFQGTISRGIAEVVDAYRSGRASRLDAVKAFNATEIIFAAYESARRRGRVSLPLEIDDNPLEAMVENGDLTPAPPEE